MATYKLTQQSGQFSGTRSRDFSGERFGRLIILEQQGSHPKKGRLWLCKCDCGANVVVETSMFLKGHKRSCGCLFQEQLRTRHYPKTGFNAPVTKLPEYKSWSQARQRCNNPNNPAYKHYWGRGIKCLISFRDMMEEIGTKPTSKHSLDRIDVNGNYEIGNIRWADDTTQARNTQRTPTAGVTKRGSKWHANITVDKKQIFLGCFDEKEEAQETRHQAVKKYWNT